LYAILSWVGGQELAFLAALVGTAAMKPASKPGDRVTSNCDTPWRLGVTYVQLLDQKRFWRERDVVLDRFDFRTVQPALTLARAPRRP